MQKMKLFRVYQPYEVEGVWDRIKGNEHFIEAFCIEDVATEFGGSLAGTSASGPQIIFSSNNLLPGAKIDIKENAGINEETVYLLVLEIEGKKFQFQMIDEASCVIYVEELKVTLFTHKSIAA